MAAASARFASAVRGRAIWTTQAFYRCATLRSSPTRKWNRERSPHSRAANEGVRENPRAFRPLCVALGGSLPTLARCEERPYTASDLDRRRAFHGSVFTEVVGFSSGLGNAGGEDDMDTGAVLAGPLSERESLGTTAGADVCEHDVNPGIGFERNYCFMPVRRFQDAIAAIAQIFCNNHSDEDLVIDDEHGRLGLFCGTSHCVGPHAVAAGCTL